MAQLQTEVDSLPLQQPSPVSTQQREISIDVLRGFAVLGILIMNIQSFSMIGAAYINPTAYGDLHGVNYWVWLLSHIFGDQKFITIFSMLFGAGIILMTTRAGAQATRLHYRRMGLLIAFGLLHAYLFWYGDILFTYGVCGLFIFLFRKLAPRRLLIAGLVVLAIGTAISVAGGLSMKQWSAPQLQTFTNENWMPPSAMVTDELSAMRGNWLSVFRFRAHYSFFMETQIFAFWTLWRTAGMMLIGMALYKWKVLSGERSTRFYWNLLLAGVLLGIPLVLYGVHTNFAHHWDVRYSYFFGLQFNYWGSTFFCMSIISGIILLFKSGRARRLLSAFAATGRMAFSNYIFTSVVCTTIFYGYGLGLFGRVQRIGQAGIMVALWLLILSISTIWLKHLNYGPLEWVWRSLTYGRKMPMRRDAQLNSSVALATGN